MPNTLTNKAAHLKKAALDKAKKPKRMLKKSMVT